MTLFVYYILSHTDRIGQDLMLYNVLCPSTQTSSTHSPSSWRAIVWSKEADLRINPELLQTCLENFISEAKCFNLLALSFAA